MENQTIDKVIYAFPFACWSQDGVPYHQELELTMLKTFPLSWLDNFFRPAFLKALQILFSQYTAPWIEQNRVEFHQEIQLLCNDVCHSLSGPQ